LSEDAAVTISVVLSDLTRLEETPQTEEELAGEWGQFLRPGSWRDYCQSAPPG
jgi:hypothetical protein